MEVGDPRAAWIGSVGGTTETAGTTRSHSACPSAVAAHGAPGATLPAGDERGQREPQREEKEEEPETQESADNDVRGAQGNGV